MINTHRDHADGDELIRKADIYDILDNDYLVADRKEERLRGLKGVELDQHELLQEAVNIQIAINRIVAYLNRWGGENE